MPLRRLMIQREGRYISFVCDYCAAGVFESGKTDFSAAWQEAKDEGWTCSKDEDEEWSHRCPDC